MNELIRQAIKMWCLVFMGCWLSSGIAIAQITITENSLLNAIGYSQTQELDERFSIGVNVGSSGANQVWDFRNASIPNPVIVDNTFLVPQGTPFENEFPDANRVNVFTDRDTTSDFTGYEYWDVNATMVNVLGSGIVIGPPDDTTFIFRETGNIIPLPLEFNTTWNTVERDTFGIPGFLFVDIDSSLVTVDGWGTLRLPIGDFNVLRVRDDVVSRSFQIIQDTILIPTGVETWIGYTWVNVNGIALANVQSQFGETDPNFTNAQGFEYTTDIIVGIGDEPGLDNIVSQYELEQNYPNPFNPETKISFTIPQSEHVHITIYNQVGQKVAILANERMPSGRHSITWNALELPSGIYLYRIRAGVFEETQKAILIK